MPKDQETSRRDSVSMVGPYSRVRVVVAMIIIVLAIAVLGYRAFT